MRGFYIFIFSVSAVANDFFDIGRVTVDRVVLIYLDSEIVKSFDKDIDVLEIDDLDDFERYIVEVEK